MSSQKTSVISVRVPPDIKDALERAATAERRSQASMVEVMVLNYCRANNIPLDAAQTTGTKQRKSNPSR